MGLECVRRRFSSPGVLGPETISSFESVGGASPVLFVLMYEIVVVDEPSGSASPWYVFTLSRSRLAWLRMAVRLVR